MAPHGSDSAVRPAGRERHRASSVRTLRSRRGSGLIDGDEPRPPDTSSTNKPGHSFHATCELRLAKSDEGRTQAQLSAIRALL
jgi:hypothetical protein